MKAAVGFAAAATILLAGCDAAAGAAAGVQFNIQMAEMERDHEATRAAEDALWNPILPKAEAGTYRVTFMRDGKQTSKDERCFPKRTLRQLMNPETGGPLCPMSAQSIEKTSNGYTYRAKCDFTKLGQGKQDITVKLNGSLRVSFTVEKTKLYSTPIDGKTRDVSNQKWEYRGAC